MPSARLAWTLAVWLTWLGLFLALELPAVAQRSPWATLSELVWLLETDWRPAVVLVLLGFGWLLVHMVARFSL